MRFRAYDEENKAMVYSDKCPYEYTFNLDDGKVQCMVDCSYTDIFGDEHFDWKAIGDAEICSEVKDVNGKEIYQGDIIKNGKEQIMEVRYGKYIMYCPVDDKMMENIGFYVVASGIYEDMPLGPTSEYAMIIGNIHENADLVVDAKYRSIYK